MKRIVQAVLLISLLMATQHTLRGSVLEIVALNQQTQGGYYDNLYRTALFFRIQNGSPRPPDNGWGVGTVKEAVVDIGSLLGEVVDQIVERNPRFDTHEAVWNELIFRTFTHPVDTEVGSGWFYEFNTYTPNLYGAENYGIPWDFERYLVFRNIGGRPRDFDTWNNYITDPSKDSLTFAVHLTDLLDFNQNGRVDPDELIIWDGRTGGSFPEDLKYSQNGAVWVPEGAGFYLHHGIGWNGDKIPTLSIRERHTLGEVIETVAGKPDSLRFTAERANPYNWYRWIYIVQRSTDLETWTNETSYPGNGQTVDHPITTAPGENAFWRILIANEKDFKPFALRAINPPEAPQETAFTWNGAEGALSYALYLTTGDSIDDDDLTANTTEPHYRLSGLTPGTSYIWRVVATFEDGLTAASESAGFITSE